jgi:hypothetical protein
VEQHLSPSFTRAGIRKTTAVAVLALAVCACLPVHVDARPTVEVVTDTPQGVSLRFEADFDADEVPVGPLSTLVRVPDTGRIVTEITPPDVAACVTVSEPAILRDLRVVQITFSPSLLWPMLADGALSVEVELRALDGPGLNEKHHRRGQVSPAFRRLYESTVVNYDDADGDAAPPAASLRRDGESIPFGGRYLIIVWDLYEEYIEPLAEWKHTKGIQTKVVRLSDVGSTPDDIRNYVLDAYNTWEVPPEYVLLVGDTEQIPVHYGLTHTDNYYATLEGSDYLADVMVGRITADSPGHCTTQVAKILGYERTPVEDDPAWPTSATLMIADDFDDGDWIYYANTWFVYDLMQSAEFAPVDTLFRRNPVSTQDVYNSVNEGRGFLNFRGQALFNWNPPFDINPNATTSGWRLPVVVSATCGTGVFDVDGYVCETWVRAGSATDPAGGVAFFGSNTIIGASQALSLRRGYVDEGFMANAFGPDALTLGEACLAGKLNLFMHDENHQEYQAWNLLGDPELNLWTGTPSHLTVYHDEGASTGPSDLGVTVLKDGAPVEDALVACVMGSDVYSWQYTDALGAAVLPISPSSPGDLSVTVTARNALPYEGTVVVLPSGPFVTHSETAIDDSAGGNGDGLLSPGETALVSVALTNIGNEPAPSLTATFRTDEVHTTLVDSLAYFGDISPDATVWGQDEFELTVSADCQGDHVVPFALSLAYGGTTRVVHPPAIEIAAGHLSPASVEVVDDPPGGDGDGVAEAGETVSLVVTLANDGECALESIEGTLASSDEYVAVTSGYSAFTDAGAGSTCDNASLPFAVSVSPIAPNGHVASFSLALEADGHSYQYATTADVELTLSGPSSSGPTGPDGYGYFAYDQGDSEYGPAPTFEWSDIAPPGPGTLVTEITDEDAATTTLFFFFDFPYYGTTYNEISVCSNGFAAMGYTDYRFGDNSPIPDPHGPARMIAPFWDDLDPSAGGEIYRFLDAANHRYVVQFDEVRHWDSLATETFQVMLLNPEYYPTPTGDGMILVQYQDVSDPGACTVGIENPAQTGGIQWVYDGTYASGAPTIDDGTAILFTTIAPEDPDIPWLVLESVVLDDAGGGNGDGLPQPGETVSVTLTLDNQGGDAAEGVSVVLTSSGSELTVVDSTSAFPDVPAGASAQNTIDPLTFMVSEAVSDTVATLWANVTANAGGYATAARIDVHIDLTGTGIEDGEPAAIFRFHPARPNPFSGDTRMTLSLPAPENVTVRIYSAAGRLVRTLVDAELLAGEHAIRWDGAHGRGSRVASGVYFVRVEAGANVASRKVVFLR